MKDSNKSLTSQLTAIIQWFTTNYWNVLLGIFIALGIVGGIDGYFFCRWIGKDNPVSLVEFGGFIISLVALLLLSKRTFNQDRQIQFQVDKEIDDRFTSAIALLGSNQTSARTGSLYVLYDLAIKNDKYRKQVAEIMCGHIRGHTQTKKYRKENKTKPADDIQTAINLLFRGSETQDQKGLYCHSFAASFHRPNLCHSFLRGANFHRAICISADFRHADCMAAVFIEAQLQGAQLVMTKCQGAGFFRTKCQGAYFMEAQCQGANFIEAMCLGANFCRTECQGANFKQTQCQGAIASEEHYGDELSERIGMDTVLENLVFSGGLEADWLDKLQPLVEICGTEWFEDMKKIHEEHRNKPADYTPHEGIIPGVLEDTEEIRQIIAEIKKYD